MPTNHEKVAVVSGGSKGLGLDICKALLEEGYAVATFSRRCTAELEALMGQCGERFYWQSLDIADEAAMGEFFRAVKDKLGRMGYLVNSAGMAHEGLLTMMRNADIARMLQVNVGGSIALTRAALKPMMVRGGGAIVNVSSVVGVRGFKGVAAYSATKAALDGFTRSLAKEVGNLGIRVNAVAPGFMETEMTSELTDKQKARIVRQTPLNRLGTVDDVSSVVKFLLSDAARFVTGQTIVVDGGLTV